jgi:HEAT repeat protein
MTIKIRTFIATLLIIATTLAACDDEKTNELEVIEDYIIHGEGHISSDEKAYILKYEEDSVDMLIRCLHKGDSDAKAYAAELLGEIGSVKAIEPLIRLFVIKKREDIYVMNRSSAALVRIGKPSEYLLIDALRDGNEGVRLGSAMTLGNLKSEAAVEFLIGLLDDESEIVRREATIALGQIRDERAIPKLVLQLESESRTLRSFSARALGKIRSPIAVKPLMRALKKGNWSAIKSLGMIGHVEAVDMIMAMMDTFSDFYMSEAARALGRIGDVRALSILEEYWKCQRLRPVQVWAAFAIYQICSDPEAYAYLRKVVQHGDGLRSRSYQYCVAYKKAAAKALAEIGGRDSYEILLIQLRDIRNRKDDDVMNFEYDLIDIMEKSTGEKYGKDVKGWEKWIEKSFPR